MEGFEVGHRFDTMGLRGNDLRELYFKDVRVPPENVLGEPGDGVPDRHAHPEQRPDEPGHRLGGRRQGLLDLAIEHVKERRQFGRRLADFELVAGQDRLDGVLPVRAGVDGLPDHRARRRRRARLLAGVGDRARSPAASSPGTRPTARCSSRAARATCATEPYEKVLRDPRIFPIFEGANDVLRTFVALSGLKPLGDELRGLKGVDFGDPLGSVGLLLDYVGGRIQREVRPDRVGTGSRRARVARGAGRRARSSGCAIGRSRCCASTART